MKRRKVMVYIPLFTGKGATNLDHMGQLLYSKNETCNLIGKAEVRPKPYGPPKSRMDLSSKVSSVFLKFSDNLLVAIQ